MIEDRLEGFESRTNEMIDKAAAGMRAMLQQVMKDKDLLEMIDKMSGLSHYGGAKDLLCAMLMEEVRQWSRPGVNPKVVDQSGRRQAGPLMKLYRRLPSDYGEVVCNPPQPPFTSDEAKALLNIMNGGISGQEMRWTLQKKLKEIIHG